MWSKVGRFVEGLHVVGDILTKISVSCVINYMLHCYLCVYFMGLFYVWLQLSLYLWVLPAYATCICLLSFMYESVHL